ncbi:glutathione S-transferase [Lichenicola cladoniae]|uniref:Glutathione S-transferase n=1 Tax=Lichenicola cladoniae TaxID=1484109 RepID=A0A6M8HMR7_9PROT|nr:glutathione S-transferase N-terminal domain-containing protein [Lichenicola cladoniae]NPD67144.1 glutathione S-transferase [Acetobacteraceae bacterium]QKE89674.1 glutathione S-transferase [Lichenicola cladoniae]
MKLLYSRTSPFSRKVRACAAVLGIKQRIALVEVNSTQSPRELTGTNPLGKVPTLITADGFAIFDSPVICEYLNDSSEDMPIIPASGAPRWLCLRLQAIGDGLMDAASVRRQLLVVGGLEADHPLPERQRATVMRTLDVLERERPSLHIDVGVLSIACGLGYLDFRFAGEDWRAEHPRLAEWHAAISEHDCMRSTAHGS